MSGRCFRPRRRPLLRLGAWRSARAVAAGVSPAARVVWLRIHVVPPDCADPETLALVRRA